MRLETRKGAVAVGTPVSPGAPPFGPEFLRSLSPTLSFLETPPEKVAPRASVEK